MLAVVWSARGNPARVSRVWRGARAGGRLARAHSATQATTVIAETGSVVASAVFVMFGVKILIGVIVLLGVIVMFGVIVLFGVKVMFGVRVLFC